MQNKNQKKHTGAQYFILGASLCFSDKYRKYIILPILVDILIWVVLWMLGAHYFTCFISWFDNITPSWLHWLNAFFWVSFFISFLILGGYLFTIIARIILAPFLSFLSESVQLSYSNKPMAHFSLAQAPKVIIKSIFRQLRLFAYSLPRLIVLLILFFIPGVNIIAGVLWFLFCGWIQAVQYLDFASDQNNQSFKNQLKLMRKNKYEMLSFGCVIMIFSMIPVVNFLLAPAATIGGTRMFLDKFK